MYIFRVYLTLWTIVHYCDICTSVGHVLDSNPDMPILLAGDMNFDVDAGSKGFLIFKHWMAEYNHLPIYTQVPFVVEWGWR